MQYWSVGDISVYDENDGIGWDSDDERRFERDYQDEDEDEDEEDEAFC